MYKEKIFDILQIQLIMFYVEVWYVSDLFKILCLFICV